MNIPIRVVGIATSVLWVLLVGLMVVAAFSLQSVTFNSEQPTFSVAEDHSLIISIPFTISNRGFTDLNKLNLTTSFSGPEGSILSEGSTFVPNIPSSTDVTVVHNVSVNLADLATKAQNYLLNDTHLNMNFSAGLLLVGMLPTEIATNATLPWGAPFSNFRLGQLNLAVDNTEVNVTVPFSFENHAVFDLSGNLKAELYNAEDKLLSSSQVAFDAPKFTSYQNTLNFTVPLSSAEISRFSGNLRVYFSSSMFEFGPLVIPYG